MHIICWMTNARRSYWSAFDDHAAAQAEYQRLRALASTYSVSLAAVTRSTDYPPAN